MEFGDFKFLLGILFFGTVFAFGFWELAKLRRDRQQAADDRSTQDTGSENAGHDRESLSRRE